MDLAGIPPCCTARIDMLRNRALFAGLATAPEIKKSLEIQGFVLARRGRRRTCGFDFKRALTWQAKI
jgi:hypothetical protein